MALGSVAMGHLLAAQQKRVAAHHGRGFAKHARQRSANPAALTIDHQLLKPSALTPAQTLENRLAGQKYPASTNDKFHILR